MSGDPRHDLAQLLGTRLDRRRFLQTSAAGAALLGIGALLPSGCTRYPSPPDSLRFFTSKEYAVMNAAAGQILGVPDQIGSDDEQVDVAARIDGWLATWDAAAQQQLRVMLRVFEHGTYLFDLKGKRFTKLSAADQAVYLDGWMRSTLGARRTVFRALKAMAAGGYYQDPTTWEALDYAGPWLGRRDETVLRSAEGAVALSELPLE